VLFQQTATSLEIKGIPAFIEIKTKKPPSISNGFYRLHVPGRLTSLKLPSPNLKGEGQGLFHKSAVESHI